MLTSSVLTRTSLAIGRRASSTASNLNFDLPEELKDLQQSIRAFTKNEIIPKAPHYDKTMEYPWEIIKKAHAAGFLNSQIPEKYGGPGMDLVADVVVAETMGYGCTGISTACLGNDLASVPLIVAGSDDVQKKFLPRLIEE
uniref:Acyl-CoA dehydrogenase/oxidase N-terminal domain-containing protein n=1 Tax=Panagrolaimus sp. JU765 TaxID=591449 RepID=A0AC34RK15_9BILA